jgi:hypothetical protein
VASSTPCLLRDAGVIAQPSGELLVLFHMDSGRYFSLNECGWRIWDLCDGTRTGNEIVRQVAQEYGSPPGVGEDVSTLLGQLRERGLLQNVDPA